MSDQPVVFLTGASSGIGAALAPLFARDGYTVALVARRKAELDAVAEEIRKEGGQAVVLPCDVSNRKAVHAAVEKASSHGPIEILVANAGVGRPTPAKQFSAEDFAYVHGINVMGPVYCIEAVLPAMLDRNRGQIVGIASLAAYRGLPTNAAYCSSKAALAVLLESLRLDLAKTDVAVTTIYPGFIKTPLTDKNKFPMPFLQEVDVAARKMHKAIKGKRRHYAFPWQLATAVRTGRLLPAALYDKTVAR